MNTSDMFEQWARKPRTTTVGRAPRIAGNEAELKKIYHRYIRMGFDAREARFKTLTHHTMKL
jgi:hypothetical protein